ncbi:MAG: hypothetical protein AMS18_03300 [Gemmatimonas sp. SG8_17]|nr:MAG: hypothetical protein AMS18_03300 [Gemmatimonas sp. SG8_17]
MTTHSPATAQPRILHVIAPAAVGGAERVVHDLAVGQRARGQSVAVVALLDRTGPEPWLVTALRSQEVPVHTCRSRSRDYLAEIAAIRRAARQTGAQVMHCHAYRADILGWLAAARLDTATVSTSHGFTGGGPRNGFYEWLDRQALRRFDAVIAVSAALQQLLGRSGVPRERLCLVQNALLPLPLLERRAARSRLGLARSPVAVGWIGRMSWEKGPDIFLEAFARLRRSDVQAVMVGDGAERESLEAAASRLGVADRIRFVGSVPNAGELLAAFDMVVLSSRTEGLPISLLEAMSAGVPLVATRVGDIPAATSHGRFAELVPPADSGALAAAMERTLATGGTASDRTRGAQEWVELQFGLEPWLDRIAAVHEQAIRRHGKR